MHAFVRNTILTLLLFVPNFAQADIVNIQKDELLSYFRQAVKPPANFDSPDGYSQFRWRNEALRISFYVEGNDKKSILTKMTGAFDADRKFLEEATGIPISIELWGDTNPAPSVFVLIGKKNELLLRSAYLQKRFDYPNFTSEMAALAARGEGLCYSAVTIGEGGELNRVVIAVERDWSPSYCLRRELIAAFGLFGTLPARAPSILPSSQLYEYYQEMDRMLLDYPYQPLKE